MRSLRSPRRFRPSFEALEDRALCSTTVLTVTPNPALAGDSVLLTATVSGDPNIGNGHAFGQSEAVVFFDGKNAIGTANSAGGPVFELGIATLSAGKHQFTAHYSGWSVVDSIGGGGGGIVGTQPSTSAAVTEVVQPFDTVTVLTRSVGTVAHGHTVTFTATITPIMVGTRMAGGTVTFLDGTATLGHADLGANGKASFSTTKLEPGRHTLRAVYNGDNSFGRSVSAAVLVTVTPSPDITHLLHVSVSEPTHKGAEVLQTITIRNLGRLAIRGPLDLVLEDLPAHVTLAHAPLTAVQLPLGSPYVALRLPGNVLEPGGMVKVALVLLNPRHVAIHFQAHVLAGLTRL